MSVKIYWTGNWDRDEVVRENFSRYSQDGKGKWNDIETVDNSADADFLIVVNYPAQQITFEPQKVIRFFYEPKDARNHWQHFSDVNITSQNFFHVEPRCISCWYLSKSYDYLKSTKPIKIAEDVVTGVFSGKTTSPYGEIRQGREDRISFAHALDQSDIPYIHYGNHSNNPDITSLNCYKGAVENKEDALMQYKYHFAGEGAYENDYFTEKLLDGILCECLVFYAGCPNVASYINPDSFIPVDLSKPEEALNTIRTAIANDEWAKRHAAIRESKENILNRLQVYPRIEQILKEKNNV
jgi:hypothetical protein